MSGYLIITNALTICAIELFYSKNKGGRFVILIKYSCPKCNHTTEITDVEKITNSADEYPLCCSGCGQHFSKATLTKFARQRAEEMIMHALSQLKKQTSQ
ncbi:ECs_2282 family putative zinc-binding protein [Kluyvera sp. CHPC 1.251]|uniref:ECs_2282 family putative zinc-binding protein n=1 Tax=Kluyvera sp. CHPC 1.251 TaxID=2995175 RepID=UPI003FA5458D